jgi:hypothetical protein
MTQRVPPDRSTAGMTIKMELLYLVVPAESPAPNKSKAQNKFYAGTRMFENDFKKKKGKVKLI